MADTEAGTLSHTIHTDVLFRQFLRYLRVYDLNFNNEPTKTADKLRLLRKIEDYHKLVEDGASDEVLWTHLKNLHNRFFRYRPTTGHSRLRGRNTYELRFALQYMVESIYKRPIEVGILDLLCDDYECDIMGLHEAFYDRLLRHEMGQ